MTIEHAKKEANKKPYLIISLSESIHVNLDLITDWFKEYKIEVLNIGGPRESTCPGIYKSSLEFLMIALPQCINNFSLKAKL